MSTRIRLRRMGANKRPFYRVVVADQRSPRNGRFIENIGRYHPLEDPSLIEIDEERALHWLRVGAQPSNQVRNLMDKIGIWDRFVAERPGAALPPKPGRDERPEKQKVSKKAAARSAPSEAPEPAEPPAARTAEGAESAESSASVPAAEPPTEGDPAEGDPAEGDPAEGDPAEGDASEGDASEGDASEGDASEG